MSKRKLQVVVAIILAVTFVAQAIEGSYLAIFPLIGSILFFVNSQKNK